ncbi:hypothetical protein MtrunA17_Chr8g0386091 [Medicago truncatula]|uniref:Uncharacterized protein n=1 Tax=Medicago truncatula TaxID=3880 RepID=A0A396GQ59_MEDTR|nr:hypothetical protein MtrunA17_Chr8g0386091 [Medicago truncatula]
MIIVQINQSSARSINGITTYIVEIANTCVRGCKISNIHVACGGLSSAHFIKPTIFKRLNKNECLVNNGKILQNGGIVSFQYANRIRYPLSVSSVRCN